MVHKHIPINECLPVPAAQPAQDSIRRDGGAAHGSGGIGDQHTRRQAKAKEARHMVPSQHDAGSTGEGRI